MVPYKGNSCIVILVLVLAMVVFCASVTVAKEDPELTQCKHQCKQLRHIDSKQEHECETACEDYHSKEKERRERAGDEEYITLRSREPEREYRECRERCQEVEEGRGAQELCRSKCEQRRRSRDEIVGRKNDIDDDHEVEEEEEEEEKIGGKSGKPYVFGDHHFSTKIEEQEGKVKVLKRFNKRSKHLKGIKNYRVVIFEANPQTFVVPNHWDADAVFFVAKGKGTLSLVYADKRESYDIEHGHVMIIPAGVTAYLINRGNNEKLVIVKLIIPVSNPGKFEPFFGAGGENQESYFNAFSRDILGAVFNTSGDRLQKIFSQKREGVIRRASQEQIRALSHDQGSHWPLGGKGESDLLQLFRQRSKKSNEFGTLFEVDLNGRFQDLNIAISFANISQGSMHTPYYNSRATKIAIVVNGRGYFEMACPHVSKHHNHYKKINSELRQGTVFVVPPGHPFVTLASKDENLEVICFEINAKHNHKFLLAGKKNIWRNLEREAKQLAFGTSGEEIERLFERQEEEFFLAGPQPDRSRFSPL